MSTCNFIPNPAPFPIYAAEDDITTRWICPECGEYIERDGYAWRCTACGFESEYPCLDGCELDEWASWEAFRYLEDDLAEACEGSTFYRVSLESGYYAGIQIRVDLPEDPRELCNEDCRELFGLCRSRAVRALNAEMRRIKRTLDGFADSRGFERLAVAGVFSNGDAVYSRVA